MVNSLPLLRLKLTHNSRKARSARLKEMHYLYKFAELGQLSTALFHDLANNVSVLSLDLEELQRRRAPGALARANDSLAHIEQLVQAMRRQLNQTDAPTFFTARPVLNVAARNLQDRFADAKTSLLIKQDPLTRSARIYGDRTRFAQVITVLLINALDATRQRSISQQLIMERTVLVELTIATKCLVITVSDWGAGVDPALESEIFKPFFGTKPGGMGIGLFITKQIIETHFRGRIALIHSAEPTQFQIKIPLAKS